MLNILNFVYWWDKEGGRDKIFKRDLDDSIFIFTAKKKKKKQLFYQKIKMHIKYCMA